MLETVRQIARRSPLGNDPAGSSIEVRDRFRLAPSSPRARFMLRVRESDVAHRPSVAGIALNMPINTFVTTGEHSATRLGPDEWLLHGPDKETLAVEAVQALGDVPHALIDVGHRHTALLLEGPQSVDMLNAGCPLDLAAKAFPTGAATRTLLGKAEIVLWRLSDTPRYEIECGRSFAPYVWEFLVEAGREYR